MSAVVLFHLDAGVCRGALDVLVLLDVEREAEAEPSARFVRLLGRDVEGDAVTEVRDDAVERRLFAG